MIFTVLGAVAELERSLIAERVKPGLRNARAKGKRLGRPRVVVDTTRIAALRASGASWPAIAQELGIGGGNCLGSLPGPFEKPACRGRRNSLIWPAHERNRQPFSNKCFPRRKLMTCDVRQVGASGSVGPSTCQHFSLFVGTPGTSPWRALPKLMSPNSGWSPRSGRRCCQDCRSARTWAWMEEDRGQ
jgi:Resolvase, N terminal domain